MCRRPERPETTMPRAWAGLELVFPARWSKFRADRGPGELASDQRLAPSNHVGPGDSPKLFGPDDPREPHELPDRDLVHGPRIRVQKPSSLPRGRLRLPF